MVGTDDPALDLQCLGAEPGELLQAADLILTVACDVPWVPKVAAPRPDTAHWEIGLDPLYTASPMRSFPATGAITATPGATLAALAVAALLTILFIVAWRTGV